ncbi:hypothetical protein SAMN05216223_105169 [Actinacidiphila yanglinensis]|uniref:Uncharacterized protein n=1 Tax=Actinacidiphila yanglinensis TaxID=310779 RepID=A0A1H6A6D8_9ACTN|nr:hypothetical protein [Actinacidiphila yanglinensis]SEG43615.1 hypothetical protein SAMN05216223_105169 [Actinacidiphila yanglinensis]
MAVLDVVVESAGAVGAAPWSVAEVPAFGWVVVSGRMTPAGVGTVLATMAVYAGLLGDEEGAPVDAREVVAGLVAAEKIIAPGGLRARDERTGAVVVPGCCAGLEDWREWSGLAGGDDGPWLGHDPAPWFERDGGLLRLWPDGPLTRAAPTRSPNGPPVDFVVTELSGLLCGVREDLAGFLDRTAEWAARNAPGLAASLVAKLDADLRVGGADPDQG